MKTVRHILHRVRMIDVAEWSREHDTPVVIKFLRWRSANPPQESEFPIEPETIIVTSREIIRKLKGKSPPFSPRRMTAIVRDCDYDLFRLRF